MNPVRYLVPFLAVCAMAFLAGAAVLLVIGTESTKASPGIDYSYATIGGVQYHTANGRRLEPASPIDAPMLKGLPAAERRLGKGQVLYGAFVTMTDTAGAPRATASRIDLVDGDGHLYRPLQLSATNPYAYVPTRLSPGEQLPPAFGTPPADNLAAGGQLLVFRLPAAQLTNGPVELAVHDPSHPGTVASVEF